MLKVFTVLNKDDILKKNPALSSQLEIAFCDWFLTPFYFNPFFHYLMEKAHMDFPLYFLDTCLAVFT